MRWGREISQLKTAGEVIKIVFLALHTCCQRLCKGGRTRSLALPLSVSVWGVVSESVGDVSGGGLELCRLPVLERDLGGGVPVRESCTLPSLERDPLLLVLEEDRPSTPVSQYTLSLSCQTREDGVLIVSGRDP